MSSLDPMSPGTADKKVMVNNPLSEEDSSTTPGVLIKALTREQDSIAPFLPTEAEPEHEEEEVKLTLIQACCVNALNMFGTGPFISAPFLIAEAKPQGPQAILGYSLGGFVSVMDSLIWAELSSIYPHSGGSYYYLLEIYGRETWGRLMAFLYIWQFIISGPLETASGFVAIAQYLAYIDGNNEYYHHALVGVACTAVMTAALYNRIDFVGRLAVLMWVITSAAIAVTLLAGFIGYDSKNWELGVNSDGSGAWDNKKNVVIYTCFACMKFGIYDFTGYYDSCFMGDKVVNPRRTLPLSCVSAAFSVCFCFIGVHAAITSYLPWFGDDGLVAQAEGDTSYVMSRFAEKMAGQGFAIFFSIIIMLTIFGSCLSLLLGYAEVLYAASKAGHFFKFFDHLHPTKPGLSDRALLFMGAVTACCCFIDLSTLFEAIVVTRIWVQYIAQAVGLVILRNKRKRLGLSEEGNFKMWFYPWPIVIVVLGFCCIFVVTQNWVIAGDLAIIEISVLYVLFGALVYLAFAKSKGVFPFVKEEAAVAGEACGTVKEETEGFANNIDNPLAQTIEMGNAVAENESAAADGSGASSSATPMVTMG